MPSSTAYLDSYNGSIDRIHTCVMSAVFSPDNTRLMAGDDQGRLALFYSSPHISAKPILLTSPSNGNHAQANATNSSISLASSANDVLIVVGGGVQQGLVQGYRWSDIISNKKTTQLPSDAFSFDLARGPNEQFVCVQAPSKKQQAKASEIVVGSSSGTLRVLNIERQTLVATVDSAHKGTIHQVAFANDGKRLASCSEDGTCKIWDLSSSTQQPIHTIDMQKWISCCAFDMSTDRLVIGGDCPLSLWHLAMLSSSSAKQKPLLVYNSIPTPIYSIALCSGDDDTILVGTDRNKLYSVPKNGDEQTMTIARASTPSPIYTISTTVNNSSTKENDDMKVAVGGSHWHIDSFTITESNIRKIGHFEFAK